MSRGAVGVPVASSPYVSAGFGGQMLFEQSAAVTVTAHATPHTKGSWTELIAATTAHANWVTVSVSGGMNTPAADTRALVDLAIGAAAAEATILTEIPVGFCATAMVFHLPVHIPKGSRVSARLQALITVDTVGLVVGLHSTGLQRRSPERLVTLNADTAASTSLTMMTVSNTWTEVTAATPQAFQALVAVPCGGASAVWTTDATEVMSVGVGAAGTEVLGGISGRTNWSNNEQLDTPGTSGTALAQAYLSGHVPAGSRIATKITTGRAYKGAIVFGVPYA